MNNKQILLPSKEMTMNYLKKHLIKLLLIPLLSGSNAGAMRGVAAARSAAGKSFGRTSTGRAADRALEPQSGTRTGAGSLTSRASIPAMKRDETLRQIAAQASGSASESSAFAAPSGEEKGRRRKVKFTKNLEVDAASILEAEVIE